MTSPFENNGYGLSLCALARLRHSPKGPDSNDFRHSNVDMMIVLVPKHSSRPACGRFVMMHGNTSRQRTVVGGCIVGPETRVKRLEVIKRLTTISRVYHSRQDNVRG